MRSLETMPLGNGAGTIKHLDQVVRAARSPMTRITVGSITAEAREGNSGEVYYFHPKEQWSLNTLGLPNPGMKAYKELLPQMVRIAHDAGKELWASVSPFSPEECAEMTDQCLDAGVDGVEINGSCPNVWEGGKRKAIPALDPDAVLETFWQVGIAVGNLKKVSFKLSPTTDAALLGKLAAVFRKYEVNRLVCCNTKPDQQREREDGKPALAFRSGQDDTIKHVGGLAGSAVLEDNLFVTKRMRELLPDAEIIGVGGIFTGIDAQAYLLAGATGLQSTTGFLQYKEQLFVDLLMHLADKIE